MASCCECDACLASEVLAGLCIRPELADLLLPCYVDPRQDVLIRRQGRKQADPKGFNRELWVWPLCGERLDFEPQPPTLLSHRDYAWLTKDVPSGFRFWDSYSEETLERFENEICAWLNVSRLVPSLKETAPSYVRENFRKPCPRCDCTTRITFFPKRKSPIFKTMACWLKLRKEELTGNRIKASFCPKCHKDFTCIAPDKPPFFASSLERKEHKEWRKRMGLFGRPADDWGLAIEEGNES